MEVTIFVATFVIALVARAVSIDGYMVLVYAWLVSQAVAWQDWLILTVIFLVFVMWRQIERFASA